MNDMSVLIKGMKMPDNCESCAFESGFGFCLAKSDNFCGYTNAHKRPEWCPLVELPEKYGNLIDGDELKTAFPECDNGMDIKIASVRATISHMPVIIEAEDEQ